MTTRRATATKLDAEAAVTTCDRRPAYVHEMVATLRRGAPDLPLRFVVDGAPGFLGETASAGAVEMPSTDEAEKLAPLHRVDRITCAYYRLLCGTTEGRYLLSFEDDVRFAPDWWRRVERAVDKVGLRYYVLALFVPFPYIELDEGRKRGFYDIPHDRQFVGEPNDPVGFYDVVRFYGMQGLLFPPTVWPELREYVGWKLSLGHFEPIDMMLRRFLATSNTPLFGITPNVVDHVGVSSSWQPSGETGCGPSPSFRAAFGSLGVAPHEVRHEPDGEEADDGAGGQRGEDGCGAPEAATR